MLTVVPRDALAIVVLRNLSQSDAKAGKLLAALGTPLPGPLTMIKSIAGIESGLDSTRDLMFVLLPPANNSEQYHLAVWLPTSDYDALVRSLEGDPERRIAAVTIAGEDLLVVRHGDWAVIMDPDERDRLEQLRDAASAPPRQLAAWSAWVDRQDAAVVVLPSGMRAIWAFAASRKQIDPAKQAAPAVAPDDLFGSPRPEQPASDVWAALEQSLRRAAAGIAGAWKLLGRGRGGGLRVATGRGRKCGGRRATRLRTTTCCRR